MGLFNQLKKDFKIILAQKDTYFSMLLLPIIIIMILGTVFKVEDFSNIKFDGEVALELKNDSYKIGDNLREVLGEMGFKTITYDKEEALDKLKKNKIIAFVEIDDSKINFYKSDNGNKYKSNAVQMVIMKFKTISEVIAIDYITKEKYEKDTINKDDAIKAMEEEKFVNEETVDSTRQISSFDYYGITQLTLIITYMNLYAYSILRHEYLRNTAYRVMISPEKKINFFLSKIISLTVFNVIQISLIMLINSTIFNVYYGNIIKTFGICLAFGLFNITIGLLLALSSGNTDGFKWINLLNPIFIFIGGGYIPIENFKSGPITFLGKLSPVRWINEGLLNSIYLNDFSSYKMSILTSIGAAVLLITLAIIKFKKGME